MCRDIQPLVLKCVFCFAMIHVFLGMLKVMVKFLKFLTEISNERKVSVLESYIIDGELLVREGKFSMLSFLLRQTSFYLFDMII